MSEEKLYAVKNDEGKWLNQYYFWGPETWATPDKDDREKVAKHYGGHIVTFVEEPEKVVLTKEQAKIVKGANESQFPANYISNYTNAHDVAERLLIKAYANGYTVKNEKKYLVYKALGGKQKHEQFAQAYRSPIYLGTVSWLLTNEVTNKSNEPFDQFTEAEMKQYGLQDCEKEEVTDDDD